MLKNSKKNPELINIVYGTCALHFGVWEHTPWITYLYVLLRTSEGIWKHDPRKNSLKIMSFEVHLEKKLFLKYPQNINIF